MGNGGVRVSVKTVYYIVLKMSFNQITRGGHGSINLTVPLKVIRPSIFGSLFI